MQIVKQTNQVSSKQKVKIKINLKKKQMNKKGTKNVIQLKVQQEN